MKNAKNKCDHCGGQLLIEALGQYGDVFRMNKEGGMCKTRIRTRKYERSGKYLIYCARCGKSFNSGDYGY